MRVCKCDDSNIVVLFRGLCLVLLFKIDSVRLRNVLFVFYSLRL